MQQSNIYPQHSISQEELPQHQQNNSALRNSIKLLHQYSSASKKQAACIDQSELWSAILQLSTLMAQQHLHLSIIQQLNIPPALLLHELKGRKTLFQIKCYRSRALIDNRKSQTKHYYILLQGALQTQVLRTSIRRSVRESFSRLSLSGIGQGRPKKSRADRGKLFLTQQKLPVCLNLQTQQVLPLMFKSISQCSIFEVQVASWHAYMQKLRVLQEKYLLNFVRRKLGISLNFDTRESRPSKKPQEQQEQQEGIQGSKPKQQEKLLTMETVDSKRTINLLKEHVYLLYEGEMMVVTPNYKIEVSKGCILNSEIVNSLTISKISLPIDNRNSSVSLQNRNSLQQNTPAISSALAKTNSTIIKVNLSQLLSYLEERPQQSAKFKQLLGQLQSTRVFKKCPNLHQVLQRGPSQIILLKQNTPESKYFCVGTEAAYIKDLYNINTWQNEQIQRRVASTVKVAQLKFMPKAHRATNSHATLISKVPQLCTLSLQKMLPEQHLSKCRNSHEFKSQLLRQNVKDSRKQRKGYQPVKSQAANEQSVPKVSRLSTNAFFKRRLADLYVSTQIVQNGQICSQFYPTQIQQNQYKRQWKQEENKVSGVYSGYGGGRVMKRMRDGKVRQAHMR